MVGHNLGSSILPPFHTPNLPYLATVVLCRVLRHLPFGRPGLAGWMLVLASLSFGLPAAAQVDTTATAPPDTAVVAPGGLPPGHSPRGALWRAAVLPGWGQFYNRQYVKIPLVYLGLGGLAATALYTNGRYLRYRHAYLFTARLDENGEPVFPQYADDYARLLEELGLPPESDLSEEEIASRRARLEPSFRAQRDALRRNRDLIYIGIGLWYGLSLLDAYVSAHLLDFDVSEDLTLSLRPHPDASGLTVTARLDF